MKPTDLRQTDRLQADLLQDAASWLPPEAPLEMPRQVLVAPARPSVLALLTRALRPNSDI